MPWIPNSIYDFACPDCGAKAGARCLRNGRRQDWGDYCWDRLEWFAQVFEQRVQEGHASWETI